MKARAVQVAGDITEELRPALQREQDKFIKAQGWRHSNAQGGIEVVIHGRPCHWYESLRLPGSDHGRLYSRLGPEGREYMYLSQPYTLHSSIVEALVEFCTEYGLEFQLCPYGTHNPPRCLAFFVTKRGVSFYAHRS